MVDPEPLLLFTLEVARHEPRLFDEVLDWVLVHERWINTQRLTGLLQKKTGIGDASVAGATAAWIAAQQGRAVRWKRLADYGRPPDASVASQSLFQLGYRPLPVGDVVDPIFGLYGLRRDVKGEHRLVTPGLTSNPAALALRLRALAGIDIRADVMTFLLTHDGGHARELARRLACSPMRVHAVLRDLAESGKVMAHEKGQTRVYWVNRSEWWDFLYDSPADPLVMPDWVRLLRGLTILWRAVWSANPEADEYVLSSLCRTAWSEARDSLMSCEAGLHLVDDRSWPAESFLPVFCDSVRRMLSELNGRVLG